MVTRILKILLNRNVILIGAIILGMTFGKLSITLKDYNIYILAMVMTISTTSISAKGMLPISKSIKTMGISILLGYLIFSSVLLLLSWFLIDNKYLFLGMVIIAASPPGVAVIPFTHILKGDINYTMIGTLGAYLASIVIAPLIILFFSGSESLSPLLLLIIMVKIIVIPFLLSRLLILPKIYPTIIKIRGKLVDFGFALIIYTAVGLNRSVFFENFEILALISFIFILSMFGIGALHGIISKRLKTTKEIAISQNLLLTVKSSGFTASTSMAIFGKEAAIPSAILAVLVLVYLLYLNIRSEVNAKLKKPY